MNPESPQRPAGPARAERAGSADVTKALARYAAHQEAGLTQLTALAGMS